MKRPPPRSTLFPYTTLFQSLRHPRAKGLRDKASPKMPERKHAVAPSASCWDRSWRSEPRSSHLHGSRLAPSINKPKSATAPPKPYFHISPRQILRHPRAKGLRDKASPKMPERKDAVAPPSASCCDRSWRS